MPRDVDDGYTKLNNEILEALAGAPMTIRELRCVLAVIRLTYGYHKKADQISYNQVAAMTNIGRKHVASTMGNLRNRKILIASENGHKRALSWGFNKYFETWDSNQPIPSTGDSLAQSVPSTGDSSIPSTGDRLQSSIPSTGDTSIPRTGDHQRKKESTAAAPSLPTDIDDQQYHENYPQALAMYRESIALTIQPLDSAELNRMAHRWPLEWIRRGMDIAKAKRKPFLGYVRGCLERMQPDEFPTPVSNVLDFSMEDVT